MMETKLERVDCPVCGPGPTNVWLADGKRTSYVRCTGCGTVYASPRLSQQVRHSNADIVWDFSAELLAREALRVPALKREAEYVAQYVKGGKFLDVGCSSGDFFQFFPLSSWERFGVELAAGAADYSAKAYNACVVAGTLRSANWPNSFFDLVSMIDMLYLVDDPRAEIQEVARILKPNGIAAIEIPGQAYMFLRSRGLITFLMEGRWCRLSSETHLYWFTPDGLSKLLRNSGLEPVAWYAAPSPVRSRALGHFISSAYYRACALVPHNSMSLINWSPKYLCVARRLGNRL